MKIINNQPEIKLGQFTLGEFNVVYEKVNAEKLPDSMKYPMKYRRHGNSMTYFYDSPTAYITKTQ